MPINEHQHPVIHKGLGNRIIQPGDHYDGRPVGPDGEYVAEVKEAPAQGASAPVPTVQTYVKVEPQDWPDRVTLDDTYKADELKGWATVQGLEFAKSIGKGDLLDLIDQHRPKVEDQ